MRAFVLCFHVIWTYLFLHTTKLLVNMRTHTHTHPHARQPYPRQVVTCSLAMDESRASLAMANWPFLSCIWFIRCKKTILLRVCLKLSSNVCTNSHTSFHGNIGSVTDRIFIRSRSSYVAYFIIISTQVLPVSCTLNRFHFSAYRSFHKRIQRSR